MFGKVRVFGFVFRKIYKVYLRILEYMETTIKLNKKTKSELNTLRQYKNESYDELIKKLLFVVKKCEKKPEISQKIIQDINKARENIKKGEFYTEEEAKKILGL